jgi:blocked-early-in-transport protein 1
MNGSSYSLNQQAQFGARYADDLEGQNDEMLEGLNAKVKLLKDVCAIQLLQTLN